MGRATTHMPCPAECQLDQRSAPSRFPEQRAQNDVGKDHVHDDVHEPTEDARGIVDQCVMHVRHAIQKGTWFASQLGHQVFVDVLRPMEIPHQYGADGVERDDNRNQHQRQSPDLDVVAQENQHPDPYDRHQPDTGGRDAFGVFNRIRDRQPHGFGELDLCFQGFSHDPRAFAGDGIDQTDAVDLDQISQ